MRVACEPAAAERRALPLPRRGILPQCLGFLGHCSQGTVRHERHMLCCRTHGVPAPRSCRGTLPRACYTRQHAAAVSGLDRSHSQVRMVTSCAAPRCDGSCSHPTPHQRTAALTDAPGVGEGSRKGQVGIRVDMWPTRHQHSTPRTVHADNTCVAPWSHTVVCATPHGVCARVALACRLCQCPQLRTRGESLAGGSSHCAVTWRSHWRSRKEGKSQASWCEPGAQPVVV